MPKLGKSLVKFTESIQGGSASLVGKCNAELLTSKSTATLKVLTSKSTQSLPQNILLIARERVIYL
jgi:hypothetical protein